MNHKKMDPSPEPSFARLVGTTLDGTSLPPGAQFAPSASRNAAAIYAQLERSLSSLPHPGPYRLLELASGSGQHANEFTALLPAALLHSWQPTDRDASGVASIDAYRAAQPASSPAHARLLPAMVLDVEGAWPAEFLSQSFDCILVVNLL